MLTRRFTLALIAIALSAATGRADPNLPGDGEAHTIVRAAPHASTAYSNIYQAPLFGALYAIASNEAAVDESALRYYASLHNTVRVDAEIRRLKALHPTWTPPLNLYSSAGSGNDEQPFWDLLAENRFEELHAGLAMRMKSEPGWKPSRDLSAKVARKEAINALVAAFDAGAWTRVLDIADADPTVLHCSHMDANWRVADAFINVGMAPRAYEIFHAILAGCSDHDERLATVRKSISRFGVEQVKALIAMGSRADDGTSEFDAAKADLTRARIAAVNSGKGQDDIGEADLSAFFAETERTHARSDLILAGWYQYDHQHYAEAGHWFILGAPHAPPAKDEDDVKFSEGAALSRLKSGDPEGAVTLSSPWRELAPTLRQTYATAMITLLAREEPQAKIDAVALRDFVQLVKTDRSFDGANALAWRATRSRSYEEAAGWFKIALAWKGLDPTAPRPNGDLELNVVKAIEGYARALQALHRDDEALAIADNWREAADSLRALFIELATSVVSQAARSELIGAVRLNHITQIIAADHVASGAQALGWLYYRSADFPQSIAMFGQAVAWSPNGRGDLKTNQGLALALQKLGRLPEAEEVAWAWRDDQDARATYFAVVSAELSADPIGAEPSPERLERFLRMVRNDRNAVGAQAAGWYRLREGNCSFAAPWFERATSWSADRIDVKLAEGLTLARQAIGDLDGAEATAYAWRYRSSRMRALYFSIGAQELAREIPKLPVSAAQISRYSQATLLDHNVIGARALGWRRYGEKTCGFGENWFRLSTQWNSGQPGDMKTDEGRSLALAAVGRLSEASALAKRWSAQDAQMKRAYIDLMIRDLSRDNPPEPIDEARLSDFATVVEPDQSAAGARALGWYRLERGEFTDAIKWFQKAVDWQPRIADNQTAAAAAAQDDEYKPLLAHLALSIGEYRRTPRAFPGPSSAADDRAATDPDGLEAAAKTWEGFALTLRALGRIDEAERIAIDWRDRSPGLRRLYLDIARDQLARDGGAPISNERFAAYYDAIDADLDVDGAAAVAWRMHRAGNDVDAAEWFSRAVSWLAAHGAAIPDIHLVEGYAIALRGAKKYDEALALAEKWRGASPRFNLLYLETTLLALRESGRSDALSSEKYAEAEKAMAEARSPEGALSVAWIAYENSDFGGALKWFQNAVDWSDASPDPKALEGLALSLRALGRYDDLSAHARKWRDEVFEVRRAYYDGMIEAMNRADSAEPFSADTRVDFEALAVDDRNPPAAQALGWNRVAHKDWIAARSWFRKAIDARGFDPLSPPDGIARASAADAKLIEGYVRALRGGGSLEDAEDLAYLWRDRGAGLSGLYLQVFTQELADPDAHISPERVARFSNVTLASHSAVGASNLGWLTYRENKFPVAVGWFEKAIGWMPDGKGDPKTNEGYALALRGAGRLIDAENFAWTHREEAKEIRAAYVAAVIDELARPEFAAAITPARLARFAEVVTADKFAAGAQAIGWLRLSQGPCVYAAPWFRKALAWSSSTTDRDRARNGLSQSLRKAGAFAEAEEVAYDGIDRNADLRKIYVNTVIEELTREWLRPIVSEPRIARFSSVTLADRSAAAAQALGWSRYDLGGCGFGVRWLRLAAAWSPDHVGDAKLNEGIAATLRAIGKLADAEAVVWPWVSNVADMKKLYIDIVVDELSRDAPPEPAPPARIARFETIITPAASPIGAQALGWYRYSRGENQEAAKWFSNALAWWPKFKDDTTLKLVAPVEDYQPILAHLALRIEDYRRTPRAYPNSSMLSGKAVQAAVETPEGLAKTVEGYVLALGGLGRYDEAERLAWEWRDRWPRLRELFVEVALAQAGAGGGAALSKDTLDKLTSLVEADHSAAGAQALAWQAMGRRDYPGAARWFQSTLDWQAPDAPGNLDVIRSFVTALKETKRYDDALKLIEAWRERMPDLAPLAVDVELAQFTGLDPASPEAEQKLAELARSVSAAKSAQGATALGWLAYQRKATPAAMAWFKQAIVWAPVGAPPAATALEGYARSLQVEQRFDDMLTFTAQWSEHVAELKPVFADAAISVLSAAAVSGDDVPMDVLARAGAAFAEAKSAQGAQALAWQRIAAKDWVAAAAWFQAARAWRQGEPEDPKLVEGQIIALRNLARFDEAEELAFKGAAHDASMRDLYVEIVSDRLTRNPPSPPNAAGMRRFAEAVIAAKSPNGAQALGWFSYNVRQLPAAIAWFNKSLGWAPNENAALGLAFAYRLSGDRDAYQEIVSQYRDQFAKIADLAAGRPIGGAAERRAAVETSNPPTPDVAAAADAAEADAPQRPRRRAAPRGESRSRGEAVSRGEGGSVSAALNAKDYRGCVARAGSRGDRLAPGDRNALGWCLLNLGRQQESTQVFDGSMRSSTGKMREEAAYGKSLALLAAGEASPAINAASQANLDPEKRNALGTQILERRAWDAYNNKRYTEALQWADRRARFAPETRDDMNLRVLSLDALGEHDAADKIRAALDAQLAP